MMNQSMIKNAIVCAGLSVLIAGCEASAPVAPEETAELTAEDTFEGGVEEAPEEPLFRGVGQEPGWIVRIYEDRIVYEADYGERTVTARTPEPIEMNEGRRYETRDVTIEIVEAACSDTMSGAGYSATVTIIEGERTLQGCGGEQTSAPDEGV